MQNNAAEGSSDPLETCTETPLLPSSIATPPRRVAALLSTLQLSILFFPKEFARKAQEGPNSGARSSSAASLRRLQQTAG